MKGKCIDSTFLLAGLLCGLCGTTAYAQSGTAGAPAATLTLDEALRRALESGPAISTASAELEAATAAARQSRWPANPELAIDSENVLGRGVYRDFDSAETTITLAQPLAVAGKRRARIDAVDARTRQARFGVEIAQRETRRDLTIGYSQAILAERAARLARDRHANAVALREAMQQRVRAGLESDLDGARVEMAAAEALSALHHAEADAAISRRALARWLGAAQLPDRLDEAWFDTAPPAAAAVTNADLAQHPALLQQQATLDQHEAELRLARREVIPDPTVSLGVRRFADAPSSDNRALALGVSIPLPLWDRNAAGIAEARAGLVQSQVAGDLARRELEDALASAQAARAAAASELAVLAGSGIAAARSAADLTRKGQEAGRLSLIERLDADAALWSTEEALQKARHALHEADARIEYLRTR